MEMNEIEGGVCTAKRKQKKSMREGHSIKKEREREHELWKADVPQERSLRCSTQKMLK